MIAAVVILICLIVFRLSDSNPKTHNNHDVTTITGYLIGSPPAGLNAVLKELNERLKRDLHVNVRLKYIAWNELSTKYPMVLSSDENLDFIFASNWTYYNREVAQGSFLEISKQMIQEYMPLHYAVQKEIAWKEAEVGGKMFMIPSSSPDIKVPVTLIRGDLRKKYDVPAIDTFSELEPYLTAIKQNEPTMIPIRVDKQYDLTKIHSNLQWELGPAVADAITTTNGFSGVFTSWDDPQGTILSVFEEPLQSSYLKAAQIVKTWYDKGYINHDAIGNKERSKDAFEAGRSAVAFGNTNDIQTTLIKAEKNGWEVEIIPNLSSKGTYLMDPYANNGVAIPANSRHAELTMQVLDLIMEDPDYSRLVYFGIEGKNYEIRDGLVRLPDGVTPKANDYPPDASGFWFTNKSKFPPNAEWSQEYKAHKANLQDKLVTNRYAAFNFNATTVRGELEQMNRIAIQWLTPIQSGMVDDVEQSFHAFKTEALEAGYNEILLEAKRQAEEYKMQNE
ncbi:DUF3502 domain-containing protein [Paenibacillus illinoisensis]|uniref:DUF3502 domain-containing protein n=1 Tax=Paenibacillus illinoisensis TaxID=59845 RepID=UPI003CF92976